MTGAQRDGVLGAVVGAFALVYIAAARAIDDSLLADAVGAGGVPQAAGLVLLAAGLALLVKSWFAMRSARRGAAPQTPVAPAAAQPQWRGARVSALLAVVLVGYAWLLPWLGYVLSVSLLVLVVAVLAGARRRVALALCTALSGVTLWAVFDLVLKVRMPVGTLFG